MRLMNWRNIVFVLVLAGLLAVFLPTLIGNYRQLDGIRRNEEALRRELQTARERLSALAREKEDLESNVETLELLARDRIGLAFPDEVIYIFPVTPVPAATP